MTELRRLRLGSTLACLFLLAAAVTGAQEGTGPKEIKRFGGPNSFYRPPLKTLADLQKMCDARKEDIVAVLDMSGWGGRAEDFCAAIAKGEVTEKEFEVGTAMQWMALRKMKKPGLIENVVWAGKKPFPGFEMTLVSSDTRFTFIVPKACGNFALAGRTPIPPPVARLTASPASDCITRPITIDAGSSSVSYGRLEAVEVKATLPDGKQEDLGPANAGTFRWTRSYAAPGRYTFTAVAVADSGRRSEPSQAMAELKPCPPSCALALSTDEILAKDRFTVDASGSKAQVGELQTVKADITNAKGESYGVLEMGPPFRQETHIDKGGEHTFTAVATDSLAQSSTNECKASLYVLPRLGLVTDWMGGKERRVREEFLGGHCAPLIGIRAGMNYMLRRDVELVFLGGGAINPEDTDLSALFVDGELNWRGDKGFFGGGFGGWDLTDSDLVAATAKVQGGFALPWKVGRKPVMFLMEGRVFLDELDDIENNYVLFGGIRIHHHN